MSPAHGEGTPCMSAMVAVLETVMMDLPRRCPHHVSAYCRPYGRAELIDSYNVGPVRGCALAVFGCDEFACAVDVGYGEEPVVADEQHVVAYWYDVGPVR